MPFLMFLVYSALYLLVCGIWPRSRVVWGLQRGQETRLDRKYCAGLLRKKEKAEGRQDRFVCCRSSSSACQFLPFWEGHTATPVIAFWFRLWKNYGNRSQSVWPPDLTFHQEFLEMMDKAAALVPINGVKWCFHFDFKLTLSFHRLLLRLGW